jgi:REP element-mobilizing transposase RayT
MDNPPLAYFITWTVYGTFLQGDVRGWWKKQSGHQLHQPLLYRWHSERLTHPVLLLNDAERSIVETAIEDHCLHRGWKKWSSSARTNHVHAVITANEYDGNKVRDQLKANATRKLRQYFPRWVNRPAWTTKGWIEFIDDEFSLDRVIEYTDFAQDRKDRDFL